MAAKKPQHLVYWDSCVFMSWLEGDVERTEAITGVFRDVTEEKDGKIITSSLSVAEVAFFKIEKDTKRGDQDKERQIKAMWEDPNILIVEASRAVMEGARDLMRQALETGRRLKAGDAIHLASARFVEKNGLLIHEFNTYDNGILKCQTLLNITLCHPHYEPPARTMGMFDKDDL